MKPTARSCACAVVLLLINLLQATASGQDAAQAKLNIVIVEGEGAINNVKDRVNREPIVQIEDENHKPVAGAAVIFFLPNSGASGVFSNGTKTLTLTSDAQGRAAALGIKRNNVSGQMQIRVTASASGATASAVITQTNVAATSSAGLSTTAKVLIIAGLAGGAIAGGIIATRGGSSPGSTPPPPSITITAGTPSVGAPK
ncbi:MAG TPA: hypothetical protein VGN17_04050 [Bryobacteraceae bacterium]|jgi:hypothetical protein